MTTKSFSGNSVANDNDAIAQLGRAAHSIFAATAAATLTAAELMDGLVTVAGTPGSFTLTTPTAAQLAAAWPEAVVGSSFEFCIDNAGDGTVTLAAGTGVTLTQTATVATTKSRRWKGYFTAVDTPAVRMVGGAST